MDEPIFFKNQMTQEQATAFFDGGAWKEMTDDAIVRLQLFSERLCVPFDRFHQAIEAVLKRSVWTHEFANLRSIQDEYLGDKQPPSFEEIMNLIPEDKRVIVVTP